MDDRPGFLLFGLEHAEPAKLHGFALRQAGHNFIEAGIKDRRRLAYGQAMFLDDRFYDVCFFHSVSGPRSISGSASKGPRFPLLLAFQVGGKGMEGLRSSR